MQNNDNAPIDHLDWLEDPPALEPEKPTVAPEPTPQEIAEQKAAAVFPHLSLETQAMLRDSRLEMEAHHLCFRCQHAMIRQYSDPDEESNGVVVTCGALMQREIKFFIRRCTDYLPIAADLVEEPNTEITH